MVKNFFFISYFLSLLLSPSSLCSNVLTTLLLQSRTQILSWSHIMIYENILYTHNFTWSARFFFFVVFFVFFCVFLTSYPQFTVLQCGYNIAAPIKDTDLELVPYTIYEDILCMMKMHPKSACLNLILKFTCSKVYALFQTFFFLNQLCWCLL